MIGRRGWEAILAALTALLLGLYAMNAVLELAAVAVFGFLASEMLLFESRFGSFGPSWFRVTRSPGPRRAPCDGDLATSVTIEPIRGPGFRAEVWDTLPESFDVREGATRLRTYASPGVAIRLSYIVRPRVRGGYLLGPTNVVARDGLGLCYRVAVLGGDRALTVVPPTVSGRLGRIGIALFTRVQAGLSMRRRGFGSEFRSLRPYQTSDDIRHIAWKRSTPEHLVVREFDQESRQDFLIVLDLSRGMDAGLWGRNALDVAVEAGALLANLIARTGEDRIGLLTYADGVFQYLAPGRGPAHFRRLFDNLALASHRPGICPLDDLLAQAVARLRARTHLFVFSSVDAAGPRLERATASLRAHGHRAYLFVPHRAGFYPPALEEDRTWAMAWAREEETQRFHAALSGIRSEGLPVFSYDRRGAADRVVFAYTQIRAWGAVR